MKIAYVFGVYPRLSESFLDREIDALKALGIEIDIWALRASAPARAIEYPKWWKVKKLFYCNREWFFNDVGRRWARQQLQGVDHIHSAWAGFPAQIAMAAAKEARLPWSFSGHARDLWVRPRGLPAKVEHCNFATACTHQAVEALQAQNPPNAAKVLFVPHGLPLEEYPFEKREQFHTPWRILTVGRMEEKKGFDVLLDALSVLQNKGITTQTTMVGRGTLGQPLKEQSQKLHLKNVQFTGAVPRQQVRQHMQNADLLVAPCVVGKNGDHDGLPNVLLEAAALGLPILTTPVGGTSDLITSETGWTSPAGDANALAKAIEEVFDSSTTAFQRAQNARRAVEQKYDITSNIQTLAEAFGWK